MQNKPLHFKQTVLSQTLLTSKALACLLLLLMIGYFSSLPDVLKNMSAATSGLSGMDNMTGNTGTAYFFDDDTDDDGIPDAVEGTTDPDGDGLNNSLDLDSDNDGIPDLVEAGGVDADNDGKVDGTTDVDGDGLIDTYDPDAGGVALTNRDMDGDGIPNTRDRDSDGDGIPDVEEAGLPHGTGLAVADGTPGADGWSDVVDAMVSLTLTNSDGDIYPDYLDIDSDNDGITDNVEAQFTNYYVLPSGTDPDGDGIDYAYDNSDGNFIYNYEGLIPVNSQGAVDVLPDYIDPDTDDDGLPDIIEGHDANQDHVADYTLTGTDADGDGLDDAFDLVAGPNSKNEGMNGIPTPPFFDANPPANPPAPVGARGPLQKVVSGDQDRAWRTIMIGATLPVTLVRFGAEKQADNSVLLSWDAENETGLKEYILERSTDGINFQPVATVAVKGGLRPAYVNLDNPGNLSGTKLYYRLKQVDIDGRVTYSRILSVNLTPINNITLVMTPNPTRGNVAMKIAAVKKRTALVNIIDHQGRILAAQRISIAKGDNIIPLKDAAGLINGIYTVIVNTGEEKLSAKLIIQK